MEEDTKEKGSIDSSITAQSVLLAVSPHIRSVETTQRIMWTVSATLAPAAAWAIYFFGWNAARVIAVSIMSAVLTEALIEAIFKKPITISDGSAFLTGLLVAFTLPSSCPIYVGAVASLIAIAFAKMAFGGLGSNIWNPALIGRAFVQFAYPQFVSLSRWPLGGSVGPVQAISSASPLSYSALKTTLGGLPAYEYFDLIIGRIPGCLGEVSKVLLILGGLYLIYRRYVNWRVPFFFIASLAIFVYILPGKKIPSQGFFNGDVLYHIFSGGLILGAFYMATDMVTTPLTNKGLIAFGIGCGLLTGIIRLYGGYPEGVCYSILLMNTATAMIERILKPKVFGARKKKKNE